MKVRIFKPHTHAGTRHVPVSEEGLVIGLPEDAADFVVANAGAELVDAAGTAVEDAANDDDTHH